MMLWQGALPLVNFVVMVSGLSRWDWGFRQIGSGSLSVAREWQTLLRGSFECVVSTESLRSARRRHLVDRSKVTCLCRLSTTSARGSHEPNVIYHADGTAQFFSAPPVLSMPRQRPVERKGIGAGFLRTEPVSNAMYRCMLHSDAWSDAAVRSFQ